MKYAPTTDKFRYYPPTDFNPPAGSFLDIGGDGDLGLVAGTQFSGIYYYENLDTCLTDAKETEGKKVEVSLFPNPAQDILHLSLLSDIQHGSKHIQLFDALGKCVLTKSISVENNVWEERLDIGLLASGIYVLKLNLEGHFIARQFVKM